MPAPRLDAVNDLFPEQALRPEQKKDQSQYVGKPDLDAAANHRPDVDLGEFLADTDDQSADDGAGNRSQAAQNHQIEIPAPESFQTPEAYRRALLEGMEAEVPDEYRALKQRYYEELVRQ